MKIEIAGPFSDETVDINKTYIKDLAHCKGNVKDSNRTLGVIFEAEVKKTMNKKLLKGFTMKTERKNSDEYWKDEYNDIDFKVVHKASGKVTEHTYSVKYFNTASDHKFSTLFQTRRWNRQTSAWSSGWLLYSKAKKFLIGTGNGFLEFDTVELRESIVNWYNGLPSEEKSCKFTYEQAPKYYSVKKGKMLNRKYTEIEVVRVPLEVLMEIPHTEHTFNTGQFLNCLKYTNSNESTYTEAYNRYLETTHNYSLTL